MYFFAGGVGRGVICGSLQYTTAPEASLYLWGGWGERKRERAGHDGNEKERREAPAFSLFSFSPGRFLFFSIIAVFIGISSRSLCGGENHHRVETVWMARNVFCSGYLESCNQE